MTQISRIAAAAAMLTFAGAALADLNRVGPAHNPSPPGDGFPAWYQDLNGMVLDECIPTATGTQDPNGLQATACLLVDPLPYTFPTNFPPEVFYHRVVSNPLTTSATGQRATLVLALEAAFANGSPTAGQQMVFARIRVTAGVPVSGTYTVTHPYGTETFTNVIASGGNRDIFFTEDVGLTPLDFTGALTSRVGPFLQHSDAGPGGAPAGVLTLPFLTNPDGSTSAVPGSRLFLGDGVTPRFITGSPFGTNYFEICGPFNGTASPDVCVRENLFTVTGMVHDPASPIGSPLSVTRATFNRTDGASQVDVMARASAGPGQAAPLLTAAGNAVAPVLMAGPTSLGDWYAQGIPVPSTDVPTQITVTNSRDVPPTSINSHITDEITIKSVAYQGGTITVVATTSDKGDVTVNPVIPPATLSLAGFPTATKTSSSATDRAEVTFAAAVKPTASGALVPPAFVRVESNMGGLATADTSLGVANPVFPPGVPYAADDATQFVQDATGLLPAVGINVLANDVGGGSAINSATLQIVPPLPSIGVASVSAGQIFYKIPSVTGSAAIRYTVANGVGNSNVGTVFVNVIADPSGPIPTANNDPAAGSAINVTAGSSVAINVLANDTANDPTGAITLDPASVTVTAAPARGTTTVNTTTGAITYAIPAGSAAGTVTFQYRVSTKATATTLAKQSNAATVTVTISAAENLTVTNPAKCALPSKWQVRGTSNISTNNVITITNSSNGAVIGTAPVVNGAWQFQGTNVNCVSPITVRSTLGTTVSPVIVQIK